MLVRDKGAPLLICILSPNHFFSLSLLQLPADSSRNRMVTNSSFWHVARTLHTMKITGTVVYQDFEGGFWGIVGDNNLQYEPVGELPRAVQVTNGRIEAVIEPADVLSMKMWGQPVYVRSIKRL